MIAVPAAPIKRKKTKKVGIVKIIYN